MPPSPYEMTTDAGTIEGIDIDTASRLLPTSWAWSRRWITWSLTALSLSVQQGKADIVMAGVTVTPERQNVMDFSDSYATGIQSVIVTNDSEIATLEDLSGHLIGTQRGTTGYLYCTDDFGEDSVIAYDSGRPLCRL